MKIGYAIVFWCAFECWMLSADAFLVAVPSGITTPENLHRVAPLNGAPWDHVGDMVGTSGSGVYLGNGWVITANHVSFTGNFELNGVVYPASGATTSLGETDMKLFRLDSLPPLPGVSLRSEPVKLNDSITMVGYGFVRGSAEVPLTFDTGNPILTDGYSWSESQQKGWGDNRISRVVTDFGDGRGIGFTAAFDDPGVGVNDLGPDRNEAIATTGDSGSGAFILNTISDNWELAGVTFGADFRECPDQPGQQCSYYTQRGLASDSSFVDIETYRSEIQAVIVPEPSGCGILAMGGFVLLMRCRSRSH